MCLEGSDGFVTSEAPACRPAQAPIIKRCLTDRRSPTLFRALGSLQLCFELRS